MKKRSLRIGLIVLILVVILFTFPFLFRVYLVAIPAIVLYLVLSKFDFFSDKKEPYHKVYEIDEKKDWKTKWNDALLIALNEISKYASRIVLSIVLFFLVVACSIYFITNNLKTSRTKAQLANIAQDIRLFRNQSNRLPNDLAEIISKQPLKSSYKVDFWAQPIVYTKGPDGISFVLTSLGKDGTQNTEDDVVFKSN